MTPNEATMRAEVSPFPVETPEVTSTPRSRVLVVDDVFDNRDILTRRLIRRGFDVVEAAGGIEALEKIADPDLRHRAA